MFRRVIPSIIATAAADGMPNVSYLSHVVRVDDDHVALSNQFFAKTAANVRANPQVTLILVDGVTGAQFLLDIRFVRSVDAGPLFDRIALQLKASSAQVGMAEVMRLKSADIFRVCAIERVPSPCETPTSAPTPAPDLCALANVLAAMDRQPGAEEIIETLLQAVRSVLGYDHALVLDHDQARGCLTTTGSLGYAPSGLGSEIALGDGLIGAAAISRQTIKVSDMSRVRRLGEAIRPEGPGAENVTRTVAFPHLPAAMSQIAVPMIARGAVVGVLFVESLRRLAFREEDEAALSILAGQAAAAPRQRNGGGRGRAGAPLAGPPRFRWPTSASCIIAMTTASLSMASIS
ncbi:GAF domain-containing protein [Gemmobacter lanyuensis]